MAASWRRRQRSPARARSRGEQAWRGIRSGYMAETRYRGGDEEANATETKKPGHPADDRASVRHRRACPEVVEKKGIEPSTSALRTRRSPS